MKVFVLHFLTDKVSKQKVDYIIIYLPQVILLKKKIYSLGIKTVACKIPPRKTIKANLAGQVI